MADDGGGSSNLLVIFGITGDLARKMTFRALYRLEARKLLDCPILGVASDDMSVEKLVERARGAINESGEKIDDEVFDRLAGRLSYLHGDVTDTALYEQLAKRIGSGNRPLYYLEMPPFLFAPIVENLAKAGLVEHARVAVEKPFGHDLKSARELNARLRAVLDEDQIMRVDHFLGKRPVVELEYLRFANQALAAAVGPPQRFRDPHHHGRELRGGGPRQVLRSGRRAARRRAKPSAAGARAGRDGASGRK